MRASNLELAPMGGDHRGRQMIPRDIEAVLDVDLECRGSVLRRELPAAAPQLEKGGTGGRACRPQLIALSPLVVYGLEERAGGVDVPALVEHLHERVCRLLKQLHVADSGRELVGPRRMCRSVGVAYPTAEEREYRERMHPERVIVEIVGQLERRPCVLERAAESLFEAQRHRDAAL